MFITAEIGTHWKGDLHLLEYIIKLCKKAGFDAVKLQAFRLEDLNSRHYRLSSSVTEHNVAKIDEICRRIGIEWYCMPTYVEVVDFLDPYVKRYKIRYRDSGDVSLLSKVISRGKPVIMSCLNPLPDTTKKSNIKTLYCINKYPHTEDEINYERMKAFDGFSCHCPEVRCCALAARNAGIEYLEVHVTQDKNDDTLVDNPVAFDLVDCKRLIGWVRKGKEDYDKDQT